ncbi:MAG: EAL domain-containing protein [Ruthenibacterium sp.]
MASEKQYMLSVDDDAESRATLKAIFDAEFTVLQAQNDKEAMALLQQYGAKISVVVIDVEQTATGLPLLQTMKQTPAFAAIPVVVNVEHHTADNELAAMRLGVSDFIAKPYHPELVHQRVQNVVNRREMEQMRRHVECDELTGIYNRASFVKATQELFAKNSAARYVLLRWDIERFKVVNELFGTETGDKVLRVFAQCLRHRIDGCGTYARLDADNFACCYPYEYLDTEKLRTQMSSCFDALHLSYDIVLCVGIYIIDDTTVPVDQMCDRANMALHTIKGNYMRRFAFYDDTMREEMMMEQQIVGEMQEALQTEQFCIYLQPIYSVSQGKPIAAEALVRWQHPEHGLIPPARFIPLFERNGFVTKLDYYVWECVCKFISEEKKLHHPVVPISVNVSRLNFYSQDLCERIIALVERYHIAPSLLKIEITESAYTDNPAQLLKAMRKLQRYGFQVSMDDFGSGYSSLNMLKDVPTDILKVDMKFVSGLESSERAGSVLTSVIRMAKWLEMDVIVEGVETKGQLDFLCSIGCDSIQGYYFAKPMPKEDFVALLARTGKGYLRKDDADISAQENLKALMDSDEKTSILFNHLIGGVGIYELYKDVLEIVRVNNGYYNLTGSTPKTLLRDTKNANAWVHVQDRSALIRACREAEQKEKVIRVVVRRYHQNGSLLWIEVRVRYMGKRAGRSLFYFVLNDITAQRKQEQEQFLVRYVDALSNLYDEIIEVNFTDDTYMLCSGQSETLHLKERKDAYVKDVTAFVETRVHPDDRALFWSVGREENLVPFFTRDDKYSLGAQVRVLKMDGRYRVVRYDVLRVDGAFGEHICLQCIRDLNDVKETPDAMPEEQPKRLSTPLKLRDALQNTPRQETILIVDDNQVNRIILRKMLGGIYTVLEAENGKDALRVLQQTEYHVDAVLLDIVMPVMNGYEFLERRKKDEVLAMIPVIVISQSESHENELRTLELGASDFMKKPYEPEIIKQRLKNLIQLQRLAESRQTVQALLDNLPAGVMMCEFTADTVTTHYVSKSFAESYGYTVDEFLTCFGKNLLDIIHPDDREYVRKQSQATFQNHLPYVMEFRIQRKDGNERWMRERANFAYVRDGAAVYYSVMTDITEEHQQSETVAQQQTALEDAYQKLQIAFIQSDMLMWEYDIQKRTIKLTERMKKKYPWMQDEEDSEVFLRALGLLDDGTQAQFHVVQKRLEKGESPVETITKVHKETGISKWSKIRYTTMFNKSGVPRVAIGVCKDVTEEVQAREKYEKEVGFRRSVISDALAFLEFDLLTGECLSCFPPELQIVKKTVEVASRIVIEEIVETRDRPLFEFIFDREQLLKEIHAGRSETYLECRMKSKTGQYSGFRWVSVTFNYIVDTGPDSVHMFICIRDINERKTAEMNMRRQARRDPLTGLKNRVSFKEHVEEDLRVAGYQKMISAFLIVDVDNFKTINDTYGHMLGDETLCTLSKTLRSIFRAEDIIARLGGDEVVIFIKNIQNANFALERGKKICAAMENQRIGIEEVKITCSVGVAMAPEDGNTINELYHHADIALYEAKNKGKNQACLYNAQTMGI